jgi:hypothetical protein
VIATVFDPVIWGHRDVGDNSHCWKEARVLRRYRRDGLDLADVQFLHDGRVSHGHFVHAFAAPLNQQQKPEPDTRKEPADG